MHNESNTKGKTDQFKPVWLFEAASAGQVCSQTNGGIMCSLEVTRRELGSCPKAASKSDIK